MDGTTQQDEQKDEPGLTAADEAIEDLELETFPRERVLPAHRSVCHALVLAAR